MDMNWEEHVEVDQATIKELDVMCDKILEFDAQIAELSAKKKELDKLRDSVEKTVISYLEKHHKTNWSSGGKLFTVVNRFSVQVPKSQEDKTAFFDYLRGKGIFENMITVNSQTLNAYYKTEKENALNEGNVDFNIPGIGAPTYMQYISVRKQ